MPIRESPSAGFYVEGLHEYLARSYDEAEALVNFGIENGAIAATLMNNTSSRSHTVLSVIIEQRGTSGAPASATSEAGCRNVHVTHPAQQELLLVDLAGSERVRRTTSKGSRSLRPRRSIATALGARQCHRGPRRARRAAHDLSRLEAHAAAAGLARRGAAGRGCRNGRAHDEGRAIPRRDRPSSLGRVA